MTVSIKENIDRVREEVEKAAGGRSVKVIGVTKNVAAEQIQEAYNSGLKAFGENKIQEALRKFPHLAADEIEWHFIGHLQTNKARDAVRHFSYIHSIDSLKLLQQVEKDAAKAQKKINILLEVNLGGEESKYGFAEEAISSAVQACSQLQYAQLRGLMVIPPYLEDTERVRPYFRRLRELAKLHQLPELSMGMSHDYAVAIEEGATMVRIGTAIFGARI